MRNGADDEGYASDGLRTKRLILRRPDAADSAAIEALARNPRVAENRAAIPLAREGAPGETFAIVERQGGAVIGAAAFGPIAERPAALEVASFLGETRWGFGFGTEATQAIIDLAFADARILVLWCCNRVTNARARRVIEKCGFQFREAGMARSPAVVGAVPIERFVLERRNWLSLKAWGAGSGRRRDARRDTAA